MANTFPMRKQLPNPYFKNLQTSFWFFLTFSLNKYWRWLPRIFLLEDAPFAFCPLACHRVACDRWWLHWGLIRELSHSISVQFNHDFFFIYVSFSLLSFVLFIFVYNLCYVIVFWCVLIYLLHSLLGIFLCHWILG